jgi:hypothetical protein
VSGFGDVLGFNENLWDGIFTEAEIYVQEFGFEIETKSLGDVLEDCIGQTLGALRL